MLWVWLIWVFQTIWKASNFLSNIKSKLAAINFARWWIEWVFTIRNTNWQRWWWKKDLCWLKTNPLNDWWDSKCENDPWFASGSYVLDITWAEQYFYLSWITTPLNLYWKITDNDWKYLLCKDPDDWLIKACKWNISSRPADYFSPELYFRQVRWGYLLDKKNNTFLTCSEWDDTSCWDWRFEEKNFCVDVIYFNWVKRHVTFCPAMTNFKQ